MALTFDHHGYIIGDDDPDPDRPTATYDDLVDAYFIDRIGLRAAIAAAHQQANPTRWQRVRRALSLAANRDRG